MQYKFNFNIFIVIISFFVFISCEQKDDMPSPSTESNYFYKGEVIVLPHSVKSDLYENDVKTLLKGIVVSIVGTSFSTSTDSNGVFTFKNINKGIYNVVALGSDVVFTNNFQIVVNSIMGSQLGNIQPNITISGSQRSGLKISSFEIIDDTSLVSQLNSILTGSLPKLWFNVKYLGNLTIDSENFQFNDEQVEYILLKNNVVNLVLSSLGGENFNNGILFNYNTNPSNYYLIQSKQSKNIYLGFTSPYITIIKYHFPNLATLYFKAFGSGFAFYPFISSDNDLNYETYITINPNASNEFKLDLEEYF